MLGSMEMSSLLPVFAEWTTGVQDSKRAAAESRWCFILPIIRHASLIGYCAVPSLSLSSFSRMRNQR